MKDKKVLMLFVDGLGLGSQDENNPLVYTSTPGLSSVLLGKKLVRRNAGTHGDEVSLLELDSTLGVSGLPQSASGQAALFTGENAPCLLGYHLRGMPGKILTGLLKEHGILGKLKQKGFRVAFLNAYRPEFFQDLRQGLRFRYSCSTLMTYHAGSRFRSLEELRAGKAVYMDITNEILKNMGYQVEAISPEEAARRVVELSEEHDFSLYEYFLSDIIGHEADKEKAKDTVELLDKFISSVIKNLDLHNTLFVLVSDHGNLEEINHSRHTANPVPFLVGGTKKWRQIAQNETSQITDVVPFIIKYLAGN